VYSSAKTSRPSVTTAYDPTSIVVPGSAVSTRAALGYSSPRDGSGFSQTISIGGPASVTPPAAAGNVGDAGAGTEGSAAVSAGPSRYQKRRAVPSWVTSHLQSRCFPGSSNAFHAVAIRSSKLRCLSTGACNPDAGLNAVPAGGELASARVVLPVPDHPGC
jgi:hypothetical protein